MKTSLLIGGPAAALLLASGTAACAAQPGSLTSGNSAGSSPALVSAALSSQPASQTVPLGVTGARLTSVVLASLQRGYGLFVSQAGARWPALSGVTADGGAHFRSAAVITSWNCNNSAPVSRITADGADNTFAYGPSLFIARNAAGPWRKSPQPGTVLSVSAAGHSVWMLLVRCRGAAITPHGCVLNLAESINGGRTWHAAKSEPPGATTSGSSNGPAYEPAAGQTWLVGVGMSAAYVLASPEANSRGKPDSAALWYTADAGTSWSKRRIPCGTDALSVSMARSPGGALVAVCADQPSAGFQAKTTAISSNGGRTWTLRTGCMFSPGCRDPLYDGYLGQVAAVSARTAYLVGARTPLLVTADGGRHWRAVRPAIGDPSGGTYQVTFLSRSDGVVIGSGGTNGEGVEMFRTFNGGRTWSQVVPRLS